MELLQLKYFCDAARTENYSKTAKKFLVPTSNISQSVKRLEQELGTELFEHRSNKIILLDEGRRFYEKANTALLLLEEAKNEVSNSEKEISGEIKILILCNRSLLTKAIENFKEAYPEINFILKHDKDTSDEFDIMISDKSYGTFIEYGLLADEEILLAMNKTHPLAKKPSLSFEDFKNERFISMPKSASLYSITYDIFKSFGAEPNITIETDDPSFVRKYIELGLGISFIPSYSWHGLLSDNVILRNVGSYRRKTYIYLPRSRKIRKAVKEFLIFLNNSV